jgi:hypothetical protein
MVTIRVVPSLVLTHCSVTWIDKRTHRQVAGGINCVHLTIRQSYLSSVMCDRCLDLCVNESHKGYYSIECYISQHLP